MNKLKAFSDALYGFAIGDALGVPVEFFSRQEIDKNPVMDMRAFGTHNQPCGTWSDDTSLVLASTVTLTDTQTKTAPEELCIRIMEELCCFYHNAAFTCDNQVFDIGITTEQAILNYSNGMDIFSCGITEELSNGNGALSRMLPVAFWLVRTHKSGYTLIHNSCQETQIICMISGLTHAHARSKLASVIYVNTMLWLLNGVSIPTALHMGYSYGCKAWNNLFDTSVEERNFSGLQDIIRGRRERQSIKSSGYVVDTIEAVFWCLLNSFSYQDCVLKAVNLGEDTDTIAALAGSLAAVYYGKSSKSSIFPDKWMENLRCKEQLEKAIQAFS